MFLLLSCNSFLCILICDLCFLPFFGLSFHFIDSVFWSTKVLNFDDTNLFFIWLLIAKKESYLRNHCPIQGHEDLALCFLLGTFIFIYFFFNFYLFIYLFYQLEANYFTILQWFLSYIDMNQPWLYMYSPLGTVSFYISIFVSFGGNLYFIKK